MAEHLADSIRTWVRRPAAQDAALAVALLLVGLQVNPSDLAPNELVAAPVGGAPLRRTELWWAASGFAAVGVALRRRWPLPALGVCAAAAVVHLAIVMPIMIIDLSVPILLFTVAARYGWRVSLAALASMLLLALGSSVFAVAQLGPSARSLESLQGLPPLQPPTADEPAPGQLSSNVHKLPPVPFWAMSWNDLPGLGLALIASWAIGSGTRSRRAYLDELRGRAIDLEREQGQLAALAVAAERGRISRELHDVVAHGLSVMVIQAQGGAAALDNRPADTRAALDAIVKTGRDSLADMRRVLATVGEVDDAWHPQPGLGRLPALLAQVRDAGTPVRLVIDGVPIPLPAAVDLSAYRIVQEALTNTMNHAGAGTSAEVVVGYAGSEICVEVSDDGPSVARDAGLSVARDAGRGNGLRGMRERVRLLGGRLDAGPRPEGGFIVRVALPVEECRE